MSHPDAVIEKSHNPETVKWLAGVGVALVVSWLLYRNLKPFSEWVIAKLPVERASHRGEAAALFIYDSPKALLLLMLVVNLRTWSSTEISF